MALRHDLVDRKGKSSEMPKRGIRLTDEENTKLNELMDATGMNLRDLIASLIEEKYKNLKLDSKKL